MTDRISNTAAIEAKPNTASVFADLSDNSRRVYRFIVKHNLSHQGNSPTITEIQGGLEISSRSVVDWHLDKLERSGLIVRVSGSSRGIIVIGGGWTLDEEHTALLSLEADDD